MTAPTDGLALVRHETISAAVLDACKAIYEIHRYGDIVSARRLLEAAAAKLAKAQGMSTALAIVAGEANP